MSLTKSLDDQAAELYDLAMCPQIDISDSRPQIHWDQTVKACERITANLSEIILSHHRIPLLRVFAYEMPRGWQVSQHQHSYYEMSLILHGRAQDQSGTRQRLGAGHVFVHGPHQPHHWKSPWGKCRRLVVCFNVDPVLPMVIPVTWPCWSHLLPVAHQLIQLAHDAQPGWQDRVHARLAVLLSEAMSLGRFEPVKHSTSSAKSHDLVQRVEVFLEDNLANPIKLSDVAVNMAVSLSSLTHQYQKQTGQSIGQRLITLRMEQAAYLLRETQWPLQRIAQQVGIRQSAYFCRLFKKHFRRTPCVYRRES